MRIDKSDTAMTKGRRLAAMLGASAAAAWGAHPAPVSAQDFSDVEFEVIHMSGNVWALISGRGGNIGVSSGPDGTVMVDDQFAPLADKIRAALMEVGQSEEAANPRFLINTHWHGDHTGGNEEFGPESAIIAHTNVRRRLAEPRQGANGVIPGAPPDALPVVTFDDAVSIHFNGEEIRAIHIPHGHTDGDVVVHFTGSNVIHMGDNFFAGRFPFIDLASGGSAEGLVRGIDQVIQTVPADIQIIPGHGPLSNLDDLRVYLRMLRENLEMVRGKMGEGQSLEQIQTAGVSEEWDGWGDGFISTDRFLATLFQSLSESGGESSGG